MDRLCDNFIMIFIDFILLHGTHIAPTYNNAAAPRRDQIYGIASTLNTVNTCASLVHLLENTHIHTHIVKKNPTKQILIF